MFDELFDSVEQQHKKCTVYSASSDTDLDERLATRNVSVTHRELPSGGPRPFVTIREDNDTVGALSVQRLKGLLSPTVDQSLDANTIDPGSSETFELFDETLFRSLDRRQLLLASREIEDRALRVGSGTLRAQFQTWDSFEPQKEIYHRLTTETDLSVHLYGPSDRTPSDLDGITVHSDPTGTLAPFWCLAFDGGPDPQQACVLLAKEGNAGYEGFWSYDPDLVARVVDELKTVD
ncbi:DICT sensory domain-containing protein [Halovenus sp. HT40]|uniref:DICT sensory domain-containing protein n=1 Tax=Halovenus sp. HT40 TaxID=3126691 RepID=UPI00300EC0AE